MDLLIALPAPLKGFAPLLVVAAVVVIVLWTAHVGLIARHPELGSERLFPRQLVMFGLTLAGLVAVALALPVSDTARGQIIGLLGLLASGVIAFSSSTIFANLMSGIMLRVTKPFHTGDYITVGEHFGRVVQRGLLDTEIQTENRELVALPNTVLISNPVTVVRSSGAIVSATLSLGYDIHHASAEAQLLRAAEACELSDAFVRVLELGNHAITYRVSGLLADTKGLLTARSNLNRHVLDTLHGEGIEIVSPTYMTQRRVAIGTKVLPIVQPVTPAAAPGQAETVVFDKAADATRDKALASREHLLDRLQQLEHELETATGDERSQLQTRIDQDKAALASMSEEKPG